MFIKYLRILTPGHWLKAMLPLYLIAAVLFLNGFLSSRVDMFFQKTAAETDDLFRVQLGGDNADFAQALANTKELEIESSDGFDSFIKSGFILKQKNIQKTAAAVSTEKSAAPGVKVAEETVLPPAPVYNLTSVFVGKNRRFAVINDKVFRLGKTLESGEGIIAIEEGKILVEGEWGKRWLYVAY